MEHDKEPSCPKCGESILDPNEYHSGLKARPKNIIGKRMLLLYCANCGAIISIVRD